MTSQPTLRILAASIALTLAGAAHAQAPAAPSTPPVPAAATAPATDATKAATPTPASKDRAKRATTPPPAAKAGTPAGMPGAAAVPGATTAAGTQAAKPERSKERRADTGGAHQQLQNAYADLMTPEEMAAHRAKVKKTKTYAECKTLFESTGKAMEARAKAQNKTISGTPTEICDKAKERGRLTG